MTKDGRPLRILRVITRLNVGGPARQAVLLQEQLAGEGFESVLLHGQLGRGEAALPWTSATPAGRVTAVMRLGRSASFLDDLFALLAIYRSLAAFEPDIVHTHMAKAGTLGRLAALAHNAVRPRARRCLIVHTFHGHVFHGYFGPVGSRLAVFAERCLARITDRIIAISPAQASDLAVRYRVTAPARIEVVPLGFDLGTLLTLPPPAPSIPLRCVFVGRLVAIKDVPTLMTGFARAARVADMTLRIVGDGPGRVELERLAIALGIVDKVTFDGWRSDLDGVYADTDVLLLSSLNEGTPVAVIEAMASARAVVATSVGGVPDLIEDGINGLLIPAGEPDRLADALERLAGDPALRVRLGATARETVKARYHARRLVREVGALYRRDLARKRGEDTGHAD